MSRSVLWLGMIALPWAAGSPSPERSAGSQPPDGSRIGAPTFRAYGPVRSAGLSADGRWMLTVDDAGRVDRWSVANGTRIREPVQPCDAPAHAVRAALSPSGDYVAYECSGGPLDIVSMPDWRRVGTLPEASWGWRWHGHDDIILFDAEAKGRAWTPQGTLHASPVLLPGQPVADGAWGSLRTIFHAASGDLDLVCFDVAGTEVWRRRVHILAQVAVSHPRGTLAVTGEADVVVMDLSSGETLHRWDPGATPFDVLATRDGWWLQLRGGTAWILDATLQVVRSVVARQDLIASADGDVVAAIGAPRTPVWRADGSPVVPFVGLDAPAVGIAVAADGQRFVAASRDGAVAWHDAETGDVRRVVVDDVVAGVALDPSGRVAAVVGDRMWRIDLATGIREALADLDSPYGTRRVAFVDAGHLAAIYGSEPTRITIVDLGTGSTIRDEEVSAARGTQAAFSRAGAHAAFGHPSGRIQRVDLLAASPGPLAERGRWMGDRTFRARAPVWEMAFDEVGGAWTVDEARQLTGFDSRTGDPFAATLLDCLSPIAVDPGGEHVAWACGAGGVSVARVPDFDDVAFFPIPEPTWGSRLAFTADGLLAGGDGWVTEVAREPVDEGGQTSVFEGWGRVHRHGWYRQEPGWREASEAYGMTLQDAAGRWQGWFVDVRDTEPSVDGDRIAVLDEGRLTVVDAHTGQTLARRRVVREPEQVVPTADGWWVSTASGEILIFDAGLDRRRTLVTSAPDPLVASADGRWVARIGQSRVRVHAADGTEVVPPVGLVGPPTVVGVDPPYTLAGDDQHNLWIDDGSRGWTVVLPDSPRGVQIAARGDVAVVDVGWRAWRVDLPEGDRAEIPLYDVDIRTSALSDDGRWWVAIVGRGPSEVVWVDTATLEVTGRAELGWIVADTAELSGDGSTLVVSRIDGTLQRLDGPTAR